MTRSNPTSDRRAQTEEINHHHLLMESLERSNKKRNIQQQRYAILVIDMQNDFLKGNLKCERATQIIPNIRILIDTARRKQIPIFYCMTNICQSILTR